MVAIIIRSIYYQKSETKLHYRYRYCAIPPDMHKKMKKRVVVILKNILRNNYLIACQVYCTTIELIYPKKSLPPHIDL